MKYVWAIFILAVILKSVWRLVERARAQGNYGDARAGLPSRQGDQPWGGAAKGEAARRGSPPADAPAPVLEEKLRSARMDGAPTGAEPGWERQLEKSFREGRLRENEGAAAAACPGEDQAGTAARRRQKRHGDADMFDDLICPGEMIRGVVWSEILGPRGGLRAKKRPGPNPSKPAGGPGKS